MHYLAISIFSSNCFVRGCFWRQSQKVSVYNWIVVLLFAQYFFVLHACPNLKETDKAFSARRSAIDLGDHWLCSNDNLEFYSQLWSLIREEFSGSENFLLGYDWTGTKVIVREGSLIFTSKITKCYLPMCEW